MRTDSRSTSASHRVLLVREWDQQVGSSGCCGRLNSSSVEALSPGADNPYAEARERMEQVGRVYTALRAEYDEERLDVTVVDPRNLVWLLPTLWRDGRRRGMSRAQVLRECQRATVSGALVCNGHLLGRDLGPNEAVAAVRADLTR